MSVGSRISDLRKEKQISQGQLAKDLGVSRQAVSKWENDQTSPDTLNLIRLSEILDSPVEFLATGRMPEPEIRVVELAPPPPPPPPAPIYINLVDRSKEPLQKVVIKKIPEKVYVTRRAKLNPVFWVLFAGLWFILGLILGHFI